MVSCADATCSTSTDLSFSHFEEIGSRGFSCSASTWVTVNSGWFQSSPRWVVSGPRVDVLLT